jgi:hypothetical protein
MSTRPRAQSNQESQKIQESRILTLAEGTEIPLATIEDISSKTVHKGQIIPLMVTKDIQVDGQVVIKKGTLATGHVSDVKQKALAQAGSVNIMPLYIMSGTQNIRLKGSAIGTEGSVNAAATILEFMTALPFTKKHGQAVIPAGTAISAANMRAVTLSKPE